MTDCALSLVSLAPPSVGAEVETAGRAGHQQVPVWAGPGVPPPRTGLRGPAAAGHGLGQRCHGGQTGRGRRARRQEQRGIHDLLPAGEVSHSRRVAECFVRCFACVGVSVCVCQCVSSSQMALAVLPTQEHAMS